ncbi:pirin family protein [Mobilitalea sibirica]|uniref:Pirin family protein n=1 Tax=Mobilitalea sibirica TaxID=1462919 RepID=A0A8J7KW07_9FIRM|nr:pirin family protein [Mobilitalea sibirica]MBH1939777.1 pirin family protein [Mobilitalea sibirica]
MAYREIKQVISGVTQFDGAGVKLVRVIGYSNVKDFDPFLMLDAFDSNDPKDYIKGFPWHPHRGIETVTYLIHGEIEHKDSIGNQGSIRDGSCQWMTAGKAILHQEMPQPSNRMLGIQLWVNLPKKDKMVPPQYRDILPNMIPRIEKNGCRVGVLAGNYEGKEGATQGDYVKAMFLDVEMKPDSSWTLSTEPQDTVFIYIVEGEGYFGGSIPMHITSKKAVLFHEGNELKVSTSDKSIRFFVFSGKPLQEPIAWGGPIVMNTGEELEKAFQEIREGTFGKK